MLSHATSLHPLYGLGAICVLGGLTGAQQDFQKLTAADALPGAAFGRAVSMDGDFLAVAARNQGSAGPFFFDGEGAVYVYHNSGTVWGEAQELVSLDADVADWFGTAVDLDGEYLVVGAIGDDDLGSASGSAYVFHRDGIHWTQMAKLLASDGKRDDEFGRAVALTENLALVGAPVNDLDDPGRAYIFRFDGSAWTQEAELFASDGAARDDFGISVSISGDVAAVGAWNAGNTGQSFPDGSGAVYIYRHDFITGAWLEEAKLVASGTLPGERDRYGHAVSMDGDSLLVGTWPISFSAPAPKGSAYTYQRGIFGWELQTKLLASDGEPGDVFGHAVSLSGDLALVGAWGEWSPSFPCSQSPPFPGVCNAGSAYAFRSEGTLGWVEEAKLIPSDIDEGDAFAWSVAASGDRAVVGAWRDADGGLDSGSSYVFHGLGDCNGNGVLDIHDLAAGSSADANQNGVADECECPAPINYCNAMANSTGSPARMGAQGLASLSIDDFRLTASGAPAGVSGLFFYGSSQVSLPFGDGLRCVGGAQLYRLPPVLTTDAAGFASHDLDFVTPPAGSGPGQIVAGTTWFFQFWFRDAAAGGAGFNTSDGLEVVSCP